MDNQTERHSQTSLLVTAKTHKYTAKIKSTKRGVGGRKGGGKKTKRVR
jgi:hypothetical protein